jgi:hypothetical protein
VHCICPLVTQSGHRASLGIVARLCAISYARPGRNLLQFKYCMGPLGGAHATTRFCHRCRRRIDYVAARGAGAAVDDAGGRVSPDWVGQIREAVASMMMDMWKHPNCGVPPEINAIGISAAAASNVAVARAYIEGFN